MKRIVMLGGAALGSGLAARTSYAMRELMAAFALFGVGFCVLLLLFVFGFLAIRAAAEINFWVRMRSPLWNRAGRDWIFALRQSARGRAKPWPMSVTPNE